MSDDEESTYKERAVNCPHANREHPMYYLAFGINVHLPSGYVLHLCEQCAEVVRDHVLSEYFLGGATERPESESPNA